MTKSTKASPKVDTAMDYDHLLRANAKRVFSEPGVERRLTALKELWAENGVLVENEQVVTGWDAVSGSVGALLKMLPPGATFEAEGPAAGHHGLGRLRWRAVDSSGKPLGVAGTDIAFVEDGRIAKLYVILDPP
jgi:SnoaL-like domain